MQAQQNVHLRIEFDDGTHKFFTCSGAHNGSGRIDDVYSYRHATKTGWRFLSTKRTPVSKPTAVCPECVKESGVLH